MTDWNGEWKFVDVSVTHERDTDVQGCIEDEGGNFVAELSLGYHETRAGVDRAVEVGRLFAKAPRLHRLVKGLLQFRDEKNPAVLAVGIKLAADEAARLLGETGTG